MNLTLNKDNYVTTKSKERKIYENVQSSQKSAKEIKKHEAKKKRLQLDVFLKLVKNSKDKIIIK